MPPNAETPRFLPKDLGDGLILLQLLFGFRSADELDYAFPD